MKGHTFFQKSDFEKIWSQPPLRETTSDIYITEESALRLRCHNLTEWSEDDRLKPQVMGSNPSPAVALVRLWIK